MSRPLRRALIMHPAARLPRHLFITAVSAMLVSGCLDSPPPSPSDEMSEWVEWQEGFWWRYEITGVLPAPWMETVAGEIGAAQEVGHLPRFEMEGEVTFVFRNRTGQDGEQLGYVVLSDREGPPLLSRFGLPFATGWEIGSGLTWGTPHQPYNLVGQTWRGTHFFDWPLMDGKRWETGFMGAPLDIIATQDGALFRMEARIGHEVVLRYDYDPDVRWFRTFQVLDDAGDVQLEARLIDHGTTGFSGVAYRIGDGSSMSLCHGGAGAAPAAPGSCPPTGATTAKGGTSKNFYNIAFASSGPGIATMIRTEPGQPEPEIWMIETCPCMADLYLSEEVEKSGQYTYRFDNFFSGDERWVYFWSYYSCQDTYRYEAGAVAQMDICRA